mmetsp:Transcript_29149/g.92972  ORF Transcript_29149/g.92972 Transcript_29149/m.92972 type:complete len:204 (+) Transcript_29149:2142-2753(+)
MAGCSARHRISRCASCCSTTAVSCACPAVVMHAINRSPAGGGRTGACIMDLGLGRIAPASLAGSRNRAGRCDGGKGGSTDTSQICKVRTRQLRCSAGRHLRRRESTQRCALHTRQAQYRHLVHRPPQAAARRLLLIDRRREAAPEDRTLRPIQPRSPRSTLRLWLWLTGLQGAVGEWGWRRARAQGRARPEWRRWRSGSQGHR